MKTLFTNSFKYYFPLLLLFTGLCSFKPSPAEPPIFSILIDQQEAQYFTDITITVYFIDGSQEIGQVDDLGYGKKMIWSKTYHKKIDRVHFQAKMYTDQLLDPVKTLVDSYMEPVYAYSNFTLTLGGSYRRPYVGKNFNKGDKAIKRPKA